MSGDFLTQWAWVFWLALILVFIIVEVVSLEFTFLMLAVGSLGGLVAGLLGAPWWVQIIVAGVLSLLAALLRAARPAAHAAARRRPDADRTSRRSSGSRAPSSPRSPTAADR